MEQQQCYKAYMPYSQVLPVRASKESSSHGALLKWSEVGHQRRGGGGEEGSIKDQWLDNVLGLRF